jgi:hypothetical protein
MKTHDIITSIRHSGAVSSKVLYEMVALLHSTVSDAQDTSAFMSDASNGFGNLDPNYLLAANAYAESKHASRCEDFERDEALANEHLSRVVSELRRKHIGEDFEMVLAEVLSTLEPDFYLGMDTKPYLIVSH